MKQGTDEQMSQWLKNWTNYLRTLSGSEEYISLHACSSTLDGNFSSQELRHIADTMDKMFEDPARIHFVLKGQ